MPEGDRDNEANGYLQNVIAVDVKRHFHQSFAQCLHSISQCTYQKLIIFLQNTFWLHTRQNPHFLSNS